MPGRTLGVALSAAALIAVWLASDSFGQSQQGSPDVANQMLSELKGLRADLNRFAAIGARTQMAAVRLQLQEQRVARALAELSSVRTQRETFEGSLEANNNGIAETENRVRDSKTAAERTGLELMLPTLKAQSADMEAQIQRLREREADAGRELAYEQAAWNELSNRLDEFERQLTVR